MESSNQYDKKYKNVFLWIGLTCLFVAFDQITKGIVRETVSPGTRIPVIDDILFITLIQNYKGFAWFVPNLPEWTKVLFLLFRILIILLAFPIYNYYTRSGKNSKWAYFALIGLTAGIMGNLLDDFFVPYTTDFIQIFHSPSANFADLISYAGLLSLLFKMNRRMNKRTST